MRTGGVDLSSQAANTASCMIDWSDQHAKVIELNVGVDDDAILSLITSVDKLGIDVPLGWPIAFAEAIAAYSIVGSWPKEYRHAAYDNYRFRRTDLWLRDELNMTAPLSVSTDKLSFPAMRAAALLSQLPWPAIRDGTGVVVEVYPAAALYRWGMRSRQYKKRENTNLRRELVNHLLETATWLRINKGFIDLCIDSDDAFDALVAALIARAAAMKLTFQIPTVDRNTALREGWIAVPVDGSLLLLADG